MGGLVPQSCSGRSRLGGGGRVERRSVVSAGAGELRWRRGVQREFDFSDVEAAAGNDLLRREAALETLVPSGWGAEVTVRWEV